MRVFGSVARGESQQTSDVNFLVELQPGHSLLERIALKQDVKDFLGCRVDVANPNDIAPNDIALMHYRQSFAGCHQKIYRL